MTAVAGSLARSVMAVEAEAGHNDGGGDCGRLLALESTSLLATSRVTGPLLNLTHHGAYRLIARLQLEQPLRQKIETVNLN